MKQLWASELFGAVYIAFNIAFYYSNGHDDIYAMWDWGKDPSTAIAYSAAVLLVLLPSFAVMHLGVFRWAWRGGFRVFLEGTMCYPRIVSNVNSQMMLSRHFWELPPVTATTSASRKRWWAR